jgi:hypothetical protein
VPSQKSYFPLSVSWTSFWQKGILAALISPILLPSPLSTKQATTSGRSFVPVPLSPPHTFKAFVLSSSLSEAYRVQYHDHRFLLLFSSRLFFLYGILIFIQLPRLHRLPIHTIDLRLLSSHHNSTPLLGQIIEFVRYTGGIHSANNNDDKHESTTYRLRNILRIRAR